MGCRLCQAQPSAAAYQKFRHSHVFHIQLHSALDRDAQEFNVYNVKSM